MWKKKRMLVLLTVFLLTGCKAGVGIDLKKNEPEQKVDYMICSEKNQPDRLKEIIRQRRKNPCTFAWKNSGYTYLVVCYGAKSYSGYSIKIEKCVKSGEELLLKTKLIGPSASEEVVEIRTYPTMVVRCARTELLCRIMP